MAKKKSKKKSSEIRSDEELKQIARDIHGNLIFTDRNMLPGDRGRMLNNVFIPLNFLEKKHINEMKKRKAAVVYEYYSKASKCSINGYPTFMSFAYLTEEEWEKVSGYLERIKKAMELV